MTTNIEFDAVSNSWDEHTNAGENHIPTGVQVAQATTGQAASEPVPVDVGSGAPANAPAANQPAAGANAPANAPASNAAQGNAPAANAPAANAAAANVPHEYHAEAGNVVKLPANVSIDNIKVDGHNLVLVQPDGSEIVIKDGALNVPTFILGDVEVPRVALIAALEASHVDVAFGADGSISAGGNGSPSSAGGNFEQPPGGIGDGFGLTALLPPTALAFGQPDHRELFPGLAPNSTPTIIDLTPSVQGGDTTVNEKGLETAGATGSGEAGTLPGVDNDPSEHNTGTFTITSPDGIGSVDINGQVISGAALANSGSSPINITTPFGNTLTINGYDAATGQVSYTYTLLHGETHPAGSDPLFDDITITVTDGNGDISLPGTLSVQIVDDVPTAHDDVASQATENAPVTVNVFANDVPGADGVNIADPTKVSYVANSLTGGTGTITYNNDGTFTYKPAAGEEGTVTFQYRIVDGDGDSSVATVTINLKPDSTPTIGVTPQDPDAAGHSAASEAGLPPHDGLPAGSGEIADNNANNNSDTSETTTGALTITTGGDTIGHLYVTDKDNTQIEVTNAAGGILVHGQYGDLTITGTPGTGYTYSYTLLDSTTGNGTHDDFAVKVVDSDGDPASTTLTIDIVNDVPIAHNDTATQATENAPVTVNVFANDVPGADGVNIADATKVSYVANSLNGGTGTVTYNNDGTFTYKPAAGEEGTVTFQYQIVDGDGDASVATVTINLLKDSTPTIDVTPQNPDANGNSAASEAGLPPHDGLPAGSGETADGNPNNNSDTSETTAGALTITTGGDTIGHLYVTDKDNTQIEVTNAAGGILVHGQYGDLTITGTPGTGYTYSYTLLDSTTGNGTHDDFAVKVVDSDGDPASTTLTIDIVNDVPTARNDTDAAQSGETVTGNVEAGTSTHGLGAADTAGADGIASIVWTNAQVNNGVTTVTGAHGVLTVFANGDYSYQATPNAPTGTDVFNYTITDGDGDSSPATLTIDVTGSQPRVVAEVAAVNEAGIDTTPPAGDLGPGTVDGSHAGDGSETTSGKLTFSDPDGATVTGVQAGDVGIDVTGNVGTNINGTYGILHVDANGNYTYTLTKPEANVPAVNDGANVQPGQDVFTFTVTDGFGNTSTSTIKINITDDIPSLTVGTVADSAIKLVTQDADTIGANSDTATASFAAAFLAAVTPNYGADGAGSTVISNYTLNVTNSASGLTSQGDAITLIKSGNDIIGTTAGHGDIFKISVDASGTVTLTQYQQIDHLPESLDTTNNNAHVDLANGLVTLSATATVTDGDNDQATSTVSTDLGGNIGFDDAIPSLTVGTVADSAIKLVTQDADTIGANSDTATASFAAAFLAAVTPNYGADGAGSTVISNYTLNVTNSASGLTSQGDAITLIKSGNDIIGTTAGHGDIFKISVDASGTVTLTQYQQIDHLPESLDTTNNNAHVDLANGLVTLSATATVTDGDNDQATSTVSTDLGGNIGFDDAIPSLTVGTVADSAIKLVTQDADTIGANSDTATASFAAAFLAAVTPNYGADGAGSTVISNYTLNVTNSASGLTSQGDAITLIKSGNDIIGTTAGHGDIFKISVDASGTVTLTQYQQIDHLPESLDTTNNNAHVDLANGLVTLSATATVTDGDNDQATSTVSTDLGGNIGFDDAIPSLTVGTVADSAIKLVTQDADTIGANSDTATASFAAAFLAAVTPNYGADGAGSTVISNYTLNVTNSASGLTSQGDAITLIKSGNDIIGTTAGHGDIFKISVDASGTVTLTQYQQIDHLPESLDTTNNNAHVDLANGLVTLSATATVTDGDNDQATSTVSTDLGGNIGFDDAIPSLTVGTVADSAIKLVTQDADTIGANSDTATASFAAAFLAAVTPNYGADGAGSTVISNYTLNVTNSASGLTSQGDAITLIKSGNDIIGTTAGHGDIFKISVDASGTVTLTQYQQIDHLPESLDTTNNNAHVDLANGLVTLSATATVTDGDNDQATSTVSTDLGGNIGFDDAIPSLTVGTVADSAIKLVTQDADTIGANSDTATASFAAAFLAAVTPNYGADGAGSTVISNYTLNVTNSASGLTSQGDAITLIKSGNDIIGTTAGHGDIFKISVDASGTVTLTQYQQIDHLPESLDTTNNNAHVDLANGLVTLSATATVTDGDNDQATSTVSTDLGGNIGFDDAIPSLTVGTVADSAIKLVTQDADTIGANSDTATASFAAAFLAAVTPNYGADGAGSTVISNYTLNVTNSASGLTSQGDAITLIKSGNDIIGTTAGHGDIFKISVDASGTVTLTQYQQIDHLPESLDTTNNNAHVDLANGLVTLSATATVTDGDNDQATSTVSTDLGGNIGFDDAVPSLTVGTVADSAIKLVTQDADTIGANSDTATASFAAAFLAAVTPNYGADGAGSTVISNYTLNVTNSASGLTSQGDAITLIKSGNDIIGTTAGHGDIFKISVDASGTVTLTQYQQIDHLPESLDTTNNNAHVDLANGLVTLSATATVTDGDNDQATSTVSTDLGGNIGFDDAVPSLTVGTVADSAIKLVTQDADTIGANSDTATASFAAAFLAAVTPNYGADGAGSTVISNYTLNVTNSASGLTSQGDAITLIKSGNDIIGTTAGHGDIFKISVDASGTVTLTQYQQIDHLPESLDTTNNNAHVDLANGLVTLSATATVTDGDNDQATSTVSTDLGGNIGFDDAVPSLTVGTVADSAIKLVTQDADTIGANSDTATASFAAAFLAAVTPNYGADGAGSTVISNYTLNVTNSASGLTSQGDAITLIKSGNDIIGTTAGHGDIFKISVDASGTVTLTQYQQIDHLPESLDTTNNNAHVDLANGLVTLSATATVTDGDNDQATSTVSTDLGGNIGFDDAVPTAVSPDYAVLANGAGAAVSFFLDADHNVANNYGADSPGTVRFDASLNNTDSGLTSGGVHIIYTVSADGHMLTGTANGTNVFTVTLDPQNSQYSVDMNGTVDSFTNVDFSGNGYSFVGGNKDWTGFVPAGDSVSSPIDNNSSDLLLTAIGGSVNTSSVAGGVADGASVGSGETFRVDFVTDLRNGSGSGYLFDQHYNTNGASAVFTATNGSKIQLLAYDDHDTNNNLVGETTPADRSLDTINQVIVGFGTETFTFTSSGSHTIGGHLYTVTFNADGTVAIDGVYGTSGAQAVGTTIAVTTATGFNSIEYHYLSGDTFKIGDFGTAVQSSDPVSFSLPVQVVDGDNDAAASSIGITLTGTATQDHSADLVGASHTYTSTSLLPNIIGSNFDDTLNGDGSANALYGGAGNDTINGNGGNDTLIGGAGNDILSGGAGNDLLIGGAGADTLTGGTGADTFKLDHLELNIKDLITDYNKAEGDQIDLTALFDKADNVALSNYVQYNGTTHTLSVDASGSGNPANFVDVAQLTNSPAAGTINILYDDANHHQQSTTI